MDLLENILLAQYTTLGVGGPARFFVDATEPADVLAALRFARQHELPFAVFGGGSNLLISDAGFPGVVVRISSASPMHIERRQGVASIHAQAGVEWDAVVRLAVSNNCAGIECLAGIPGSVGGTPVQNVGAYGQEVSSTIMLVHALDLASEKFVRLSPADCEFGYRRSIFNTTEQGRYAITRVDYMLRVDRPPSIEYRDVKNFFAERGISQPTLADTANAVRAIRSRKGMLLAVDDPDSRSVGSFFKNPVVPSARVPGLAAIADCHPDQVPQFPVTAESSSGYGPAGKVVKLSAAWLIELAGFHKGFVLGNAGLSSKHVLAIVNRGGASAYEITALRDCIVAGVQARTGISLEQEPVMLGFSR